MLPLIGIEIPLSNWKRGLCKNVEYPAFGDPEPVVLPDMLAEQMSDFSGFACYETTFVLDSPKALILEISNASGGLEVFMNGETLGLQKKSPCYYDLSSLTRKGKNYLAIEVAIGIKQKIMAASDNNICIIGNARIYSN
jgi:hypothetical protein